MIRNRVLPLALSAVVLSVTADAGAVHFYRSSSQGCAESDGQIVDPPDTQPPQTVASTVRMLHNAFEDSNTGKNETTVKAGEWVRWTWDSAHCHSAQSETPGVFTSGYRYPKTPPESPQVVPGWFEYPLYDETPTLSYVRRFDVPGTYPYICIHHAAIGMKGTLTVTP